MKNNNQEYGDLGQHWTSSEIVKFMVGLMKNEGSILEPSAGSGRFLEQLPKHTVALEYDPTVANSVHDYEFGNFFDFPLNRKFDTIIGNPPYVAGKLLKKDWLCSWKGVSPKTANAYVHFIDKCLEHLNPKGELIFIVPYTFLGDTSYGSKVRNKMLCMGSITDYYIPNAKWESANVGTCIFRFQKDVFISDVITNDGKKKLKFSNGFIWMIDYASKGKFSDYFDIMVGSVPRAKDLNKGTAQYFKDGKFVNVDETDIESWPRLKLTPELPKIFFTSGPTRKTQLFWHGTTSRHISFTMIPKCAMNTVHMSEQLNEWFNRNAEVIGLKKDGRFSVGISQLKSLPFPIELYQSLKPKESNND